MLQGQGEVPVGVGVIDDPCVGVFVAVAVDKGVFVPVGVGVRVTDAASVFVGVAELMGVGVGV
jgi:mannitol-specific phosphotransferase system IIBC component